MHWRCGRHIAQSTCPEEATEYWIGQTIPSLDVGYAGANVERDLLDKMKSVDWLTAISNGMLEKAGGLQTIRSELPPN